MYSVRQYRNRIEIININTTDKRWNGGVMSIFTGAGVAIVTPMKANGEINYDKLAELLDYQINNSTDAIVICGTTGESATMTEKEHIEAIRFTADYVKKRVPVVAGTGSNCTKTAVELSKEAQAAGVDGCLVVTPYYNKATQKGLIEHYTAVARSIDQLINEEGFDAVFIGSGAGLPRFMGIPGENANEVFSANEYLTRSNLMKAFREDYDTPIARFKKVAVVGGGNVAMDAARTALRLGAEVHIVYRRSEEELPARAEEVHHAKEEGIIFDLLTNPTEVLTDDKGNVTGIKCVKMELGEPDASGRRKPVEVPDSEFVMDLDAVIMSLGTSPNPLISSTTKGLEINKRKCIVAEEANGQTSKEGVYAGGDAVTGAATVILAMGAGKAAAKGIDEYLSK